MHNVGSSIKKNREVAGFAMILSLALISFVFLLVITLVSQVRQDLAYSDARENHILAKAHARMGMMIAIGEIQKHLGPDMRVSATADIYDERIETSNEYIEMTYPKTPSSKQSIDLDEDRSIDKIPLGQRMWTGVWKNRAHGSTNVLESEGINGKATRPLPFNTDKADSITESWSVDSSFDHHPAVEVAWLVSGNEGWQKKLGMFDDNRLIKGFIEVPDGIYITDDGGRNFPHGTDEYYGQEINAWADHQQVVNADLQNYAHPLMALPDPDQNDSVAWLLKDPVTKSDGTYASEPVKAPKTYVLMNSDQESGNYAYWVGDQGVLSKINVSEEGNLTHPNRLMVATKPNFDSLGINLNDSDKLFETKSIPELSSDSSLSYEDSQNWVAAHYHDMTAVSYGVLSDLRTGGLKRDLSLVFSGSQNDKVWKNDFQNNWIFRDRVDYIKNLPLLAEENHRFFDQPYHENIHKNQWLYYDKATVKDNDALLAGPQWAVLHDYHNLVSPELEISPPSQFPRAVGDNAVLFGAGQSPSSPSGVFPVKANSKTFRFFNSFKDENENIVRPEPENHPVTPILSRFKLGMNLAISDSVSKEVNIVMNPSLTLWNPYNKPLKLKDIFITCTLNGAEVNLAKFDLIEYDLFRKWWMYFHKPKTPSNGYSGKWSPSMDVKNWESPWALFSIKYGDKNQYYENAREFGVLTTNAANDTGWLKGIKMDLERVTRTVDGQSKKVWAYSHESPIDGTNPEFIFNSLQDTRLTNETFRVSEVFLKINDTILEPGESANFGPVLEEGDYDNGQPLRISLSRGGESDAYLIKTGVEDFVFGAFDVTFHGINGYDDSSSDGLAYSGGGFTYSPIAKYQTSGITMYQWLGGSDPFNPQSPQNAKKLYICTRDMTGVASRKDQEKLVFDQTLIDAWDQRDVNSKLQGKAVILEMTLPGESRNERIPLNDFNFRHLIHSNQQGMGSLFYTRYPSAESHQQGYIGYYKLSVGEHSTINFKEGEEEYSILSPPEDNPDPSNNSDYFLNEFFIPKVKDFGQNISFPDFFIWSDQKFDWANKANLESEFNLISDIEARMAKLGFVKASGYSNLMSNYPAGLVLNFNSSFGVNYTLPKWDEPFSLDDSFSSSADEYSVLFETPTLPILSILQYRHANLNSYLHGPTYALGNSYASTQVARHRPYGRTQTMKYRPTGLQATEIAEMDKINNEWLSDFAKSADGKKWLQGKSPDEVVGLHNWGKEGRAFDITHDIDFNQGLAPWRDNSSGSQLNHQSITIDHSYYLNRALLDSYFLSGGDRNRSLSEQANTQLGEPYRPLIFSYSAEEKTGNPRLVGYMREGHWTASSYGAKSQETSYNTSRDDEFRYQSIAGDLLVDGAFNVNSTSVEAWISQLSSLRGLAVSRTDGTDVGVGSNETPVVRFLEEPANANGWNDFRKLSDQEISGLAKALVKQVKLRGPFLSFSDFVNRRLAPGPQNPDKGSGSFVNFQVHELSTWQSKYPENRETVTGLRGALQSAIADAGLNDPPEWGSAGLIPAVPNNRWLSSGLNNSKFGLLASTTQSKLEQNGNMRWWGQGALKPGFEQDALPGWAAGNNYFGQKIERGGDLPNIPFGRHEGKRIRPYKETYLSNSYGEAPENFQAVEHLATGANKPGWVMQSDILSPLAPVLTARSDTFTIRVMGETKANSPARAWVELVVQRTPDYVKHDLDAAHHRPHEPFKDLNLNGYWDNSDNVPETWIDLNRNGDKKEFPDLPGESSSKYRDGMPSDLRINLDTQEESSNTQLGLSFLGINQRFGRKFKIIRFRWLRKQDV